MIPLAGQEQRGEEIEETKRPKNKPLVLALVLVLILLPIVLKCVAALQHGKTGKRVGND